MEVNELKEIFCGRDINGMTKSTVLMILSMMDKSKKEDNKETIREYSGLTCSAEIYLGNPMTEIDLHCFSYLDDDLNEFWDITQHYFELMQSVKPDDTIVPMLEVVLIPTELKGQIFSTAYNPCFHALTSDNPKEKNHVIALCFDAKKFLIVEPEEFNITEYLADAEREAAEKIAMLEQDEIARMKG